MNETRMRKVVVALLIVSAPLLLRSQNGSPGDREGPAPAIEWERIHDIDAVLGLDVAASGDLFLTGDDRRDIHVIRLGADGEIVWEHELGRSDYRISRAVVALPDGGAVACLTSEVDDDYDLVLVRVNPNGESDWVRRYGGESSDSGYALARLANGTIVAVAVRTEESPPTGLTRVAIVFLVDDDGAIIREVRIDPVGRVYDAEAIATSDGGFAIASRIDGVGDDGVHRISARLWKLDENGDEQWQTSWGEASEPLRSPHVGEAVNGDLLVCFASESSRLSREVVFLTRTSASGERLWEREIPLTSNETPTGIAGPADGGILIAGTTGSAPPSQGSRGAAFVMKTTADGEVRWTRAYGGESGGWAGAIRTTSDGGFVTAGFTRLPHPLYNQAHVVRFGSEVDGGPSRFLRGDTNGDGRVDVSDGIATLSHQFLGAQSVFCDDGSDVNDSGVIEMADAILVFTFLFRGGEPLALPGARHCGIDPTPDFLRCELSATCP